MTSSNSLKATAYAPAPTVPLPRQYRGSSGPNSVFIGPNGLRVVWRILIFAVMVVVLLGSSIVVRNGGLQGTREAFKHSSQIVVTPRLMAGAEVTAFILLCVATLIMAKIEHRKFSDYGLPFRLALRKDFWVGALTGFVTISGTLLAMFLLHGFRVVGLGLHGMAIFYSLGAWGVAFLLAGLFEEFVCRGYLQHALTSGIGFWPAAFVMSGIFAVGHAFNPQESAVGVAAVVLFGLLLCLFLQRTGNLWCAVGFHTAYDWGQTLYGVPDSGMVPYHNLFVSAFSGPRWLTGGVVGPEASILTPIALLVVAVVFSRYYREDRYEIRRSTPGKFVMS
jgi:membrane protease YdiL (CAAX protease family)